MNVTFKENYTLRDLPAGLGRAILMAGAELVLMAEWNNDNEEYAISVHAQPSACFTRTEFHEKVKEFDFLGRRIGYAPDDDTLAVLSKAYLAAVTDETPGLISHLCDYEKVSRMFRATLYPECMAEGDGEATDYDESDVKVFEVRSGKLLVSDPCYGDAEFARFPTQIRDGIALVDAPCPVGLWRTVAFMKETEAFGRIINRIVAWHSDSLVEMIGAETLIGGRFETMEWPWHQHPISVCADSGKIGIGDASRPRGEQDMIDWMHEAHNVFENEAFFGILDETTVICASGPGDGDYTLDTITDTEGRIVAVQVEFASEEDDEDDEG